MKTSRAIVLKLIADVAARATSVVSFPIIARYAGADGYGAYGQLTTVVSLVIPFASLGVTSAIVRFFVGGDWNSRLIRNAWRTALVLLVSTLVVSSLMFFGATSLGELLLNWPRSAELFRLGGVLVLLGSLEAFLLELLRARGWLVSHVLFQIIQTLVTVSAVAFLLPRGYGIVDLAVALCWIKALLILSTIGYLASIARTPDGTNESPVSVTRMIRFGFPITVSGLGLILVNVGDRAVIGHYLSAGALGRYGAIFVVANLLTLASGPFNLPVYPRLMQATLSRRADLVAADIRLFHRYLSLALIPTAVFLGLMVRPALMLMGGPDFGVPLIIGALIIAGIFLDQWNGLAGYLLICNDRTVFMQNLLLGFGFFNVAANILVTPRLGLLGAALLTLITFLGLNAVVFRAATSFAPLAHLYRWRTAAHALIAAGIGALVGAIALNASSSLLFSVAIATILYWTVCLGLLFVSKQIGSDDIAILRNAFRRTPALREGPTDSTPIQ